VDGEIAKEIYILASLGNGNGPSKALSPKSLAQETDAQAC
jgi:hypothetical protein